MWQRPVQGNRDGAFGFLGIESCQRKPHGEDSSEGGERRARRRQAAIRVTHARTAPAARNVSTEEEQP